MNLKFASSPEILTCFIQIFSSLELFFLVKPLLHTLMQQLLPVLLHLPLLNLVGTLAPHILLNIRSPAFDTRNSPDITPTNESPIFTFKEFINVEMFAGITTFVKICNLLALKVLAIFIFSLSVFKNPLSISSIVTTREIASAITIIAEVPAPTHIIITGPKCNFRKTI